MSEEGDTWCWNIENDGVFSVKSAYAFVSKLQYFTAVETQWHSKIFQSIWKCPAPSKVSSFVWQLLHDRIPTKSNLVVRQVIANGADSLCPLCGLESETAEHLFLYCNFAMHMWIGIFFMAEHTFWSPAYSFFASKLSP
jgi:hypothetical protein